jgi:hypothetical protein
MKRKLPEIDQDCEKFINSQQQKKDAVSEMAESSTKTSGNIFNLQNILTDLSNSFG